MAELWKELHLRALENTGENDTPYLLQFTSRIPRFTKGCKCNEHWTIFVRSNPPVYGKNGEYFEWTVKVHNSVNARLNKRQYTVEESKAFYTKL